MKGAFGEGGVWEKGERIRLQKWLANQLRDNKKAPCDGLCSEVTIQAIVTQQFTF